MKRKNLLIILLALAIHAAGLETAKATCSMSPTANITTVPAALVFYTGESVQLSGETSVPNCGSIFSASRNATSRVSQSFTLETETGGLSNIRTVSSPTSHRFLPGKLTANPSGSVGVTGSSFRNGFNNHGIEAEYAGSNPYTPGGPDINVFSSLSVVEDTKNGTITISGALTGDNFPSTEAFVQDAAGNSLFLGVGFYEGNPFTSLRGENRGKNIAEFNLTINVDKNGNFTGVTIQDKTYSIEEWNRFFENVSPHRN